MRTGAASALLCAALLHGVALAVAEASDALASDTPAAADPAAAPDAASAAGTANTADQADAAAGQDPDLDLIPKAPQPSGKPAARPPANTGGRMYLENAFSVSSMSRTGSTSR
jgi:hypothetical protein